MSEMGLAMMGFGVARGESRAREAALKAITSPLLEDVTIDGARGVLMNITCGPDLTIEEVDEAASTITEAVHEDAKVFFGTVFDQDAGDEMRITVIATGIDSERLAASTAAARQAEERHVENVTPISRPRTPGTPGPGGGGVPGQPSSSGGGVLQSPRAAKILTAATANDYNIPAYIRKGVKKNPEAIAPQAPAKAHAPGEEEFIFDEEEFEIPSFIRMQAD
jgi:cell division protein FtsZ